MGIIVNPLVLSMELSAGRWAGLDESFAAEVRFGSHGEDSWGNKKIYVLDSVPIIPDGPQIQLSFYDWHGNVTPTRLNDYDLSLTFNNWITDAFAICCTLTSYEAMLTAKRGLRNRLSYFLLVPWLMLTLVVTTTFTASLGSLVTSSQVVPSDLDIDSLKRTNAAIACDGNPFTVSFLEKNLGFKSKNIRNITSIDDYSEVLSSGNISAAFLLTHDAKVFLAKYYREGFTKSGPAFNLGSFAFVFPRGSPLASDVSEAILELKEAGELKQMEKDRLSSDYSGSESDETVSKGIGPGAFSCLFILSGGASASALLITVIDMLKKRWESYIRRLLMGRGLIRIWLTILFSQHNPTTNELQLSRTSSNIQI